MKTTSALRYNEHGAPNEVIHLGKTDLPAMCPTDVVVAMVYAAIHPSDFGMIGGTYGSLKALPATAGREGIGRIVEIGSAVDGIAVGDLVQIPASQGTWQEAFVLPAEGLRRLPPDLPLEQLALADINPPTALLLLTEFCELSAGDWIVQNAANSAVGVAVQQIAKDRCIRVLNIVRREAAAAQLRQIGADAVALEDSGYHRQLADLTGGEKPKLALNSIGGESALNLSKCLADDGIHVTFGAMDFSPVRWPTRQLIFSNMQFVGFWYDRFRRTSPADRVEAVQSEVFDLIRRRVCHTPVTASFRITAFQEAFATATFPRFGKVLFRGAG